MVQKKSSSRKNGQQASAQKTKETQNRAPEQQHELIAQAAYFIAEERGFPIDAELENWLQAESDINKQFSTGA